MDNNADIANRWLDALRSNSNINMDEVSDGYHTFGELYEFRKQYNAALFNTWYRLGVYDVHKSFKHHDGEYCFGKEGEWFIVCATLPTGQISNHYKVAEWDLFGVPAVGKAKHPWDGHTPQDVIKRLDELNRLGGGDPWPKDF